ncbi:hypothetical protein [Zunongwangia sp. H14]|uniref:phosphoribosyltransferase-like protein n=1 Tax=Zunongwangia sp. H14 TaxID=3240792 RepID=UPI003562469F
MNEKYIKKIKLLNETIWENKVSKNKIDSWLDNFEEEEKNQALYLLTQFIYYSEFSVEKLLEALYRDVFKYQIIFNIRKRNENTLDHEFLEDEFIKHLKKTRFVSLGNPSESSATMMGLMRKINNLPTDLFISEEKLNSKLGEINHFIFIDDLCGSGNQAVTYSNKSLPNLKRNYPDAKVWYLMLVATQKGKKNIIDNSKFDYVESIHELDDSYKCFYPDSRIFTNKDSDIDPIEIKKFTGKYGKPIWQKIISKQIPEIDPVKLDQISEDHKHGYGDGQLLLGFHHNTPDNTLPIIWCNEEYIDWKAIFKRSNKIYSL